ncbi:DNA repair protein [Aureobasidium subglaciale]|nr:DNA repair protein [Aureobasidium subglaciale]
MNYNHLTVAGLQEELLNRSLSHKDIKLKKHMVARLQQDDIDNTTDAANADSPSKTEPIVDSSAATLKAEPSEYGSDDLFDELDADALISASQQSQSTPFQPKASFAVPPTPTLKRPLPEDDEEDFSGDDMFNDPSIEEIWTSSQKERRNVEQPPADKPEHIALVRSLLREKFGYPGFRGEQEKIILSVMRGENTLAIFPTGAGKSLCYQIPAIAFPLMDELSGNKRPHGAGITIVVSPLIALMKDQTDSLKRRGIAADCLDSTKTYEQHQQIHADIHAGCLRLLYVSPEKLSNEAFVASMKHVAGGVRLVAVDEAHCISEWGHSFRPSFLLVSRFVAEVKAERVICLTATATPKVAEDVRAAFGILERNEFRTSPYRSNLRLEAVATESQEAKLPLLFKWLREHPGSAIVYVTLQQQAEELCKTLRKHSFNAAFYHAGMKVEEKAAVQDSFMADEIRIVVATIAFGMGIDKSDIRGVIHLDLASTVEEYSQQIGRAGRDGDPAYCILFVSHSDIYLRQNFALGDLPSRNSLLQFLKDVFGRERIPDAEGEVIKLAHRELSTLYDIRLSPLGVTFAALELRFGLLRAITPEYTSYQFEDKGRYHATASSDHSPEARAIYSMSTKAVKNFTFDMNAATRTGLIRADLIRKLDSWNALGVIMLKTSGVMNRYRILNPLPTANEDVQALADDLHADMARREQDALGRIDQMIGLVTGEGCFAFGLAQHFGMGLPDNKRSCGHCTYCAWGESPSLPPKPAPPVNVDGIRKILAICPHDDPRLLARVAFGIKSPRITQLKLDKSPVFESLADHEFSTLVREFEAALKVAQAKVAVAEVVEAIAAIAVEAQAAMTEALVAATREAAAMEEVHTREDDHLTAETTAENCDVEEMVKALKCARAEEGPHMQRSNDSMSDNNEVPVKLSLPLEFQQDIFRELREEDELIIMARGLGLLRIVTNLLHSYDAAGNNLIVVVGADDRENGWIGEALAEHAAISASPKCRGLSLVNTDLTDVGQREKMYKQGGIFSVTSRILVVDLLTENLDPAKITGLVVLHSERIAATSLEAFIVRVYRQKNKQGFLKAFSDAPEPFASGFAPLATMMRNLFLRRPSLYPRFHVTVAKSLEGRRKAEVIELEVPMTDGMRDIQNAIMECVEVSITELKKGNTGLDMEDWNLDSALHRNFDAIVRRQLDPVWHRTNFRTRQIVRDLALLRNMLHYLLTFDAVSFLRYLDTVLAASSPPPGSNRQNQSPWLFLDAAHVIFDNAKRRVYTGNIKDSQSMNSKTGVPDSLRPVLEEMPKWNLLSEILEEIERDMYFNPSFQDESNGSILIMCGDQGTCRQIREYLQSMNVLPDKASATDNPDDDDDDDARGPSGAAMMRRKLRNYFLWKRDFNRVSNSLFAENQKNINGTTDQRHGQAGRGGRGGGSNKRRRMRGGSIAASVPTRTANGSIHVAGDKESHVQSLLAELEPTEAEAQQKAEIGADPLDDMDDFYELYDMKDLLMVHPYDGDMDEHILEETKPRYVIMYEPDAAFIRRIEVYRSSHSNRNVRVYFMYYGGSVEEQRYLSAVRKEKDAFTKLIRERGSMAVTLTHDPAGLDPQESFLRTVNTRIAGGGRLMATAEPPRVVIDVREFRSSLPSLLHGRNMVIVPCTLTVGDYVLTPEICIERKSIKDLIQSFQNGRLYHQAETMQQHYKSPMLLIEFDAQKSFTLEPFADLSAGVGSSSLQASDLQSKLVLLTLAFPRLRIIWSSSPYQTAEIFEELKKQQEEPDPIKAVNIGLEESDMDGQERTFNQLPQDMLRAVPGVNPKNLNNLILKYENVAEIANADEDELTALIGKEAGRQIFRFFNRSVFDD